MSGNVGSVSTMAMVNILRSGDQLRRAPSQEHSLRADDGEMNPTPRASQRIHAEPDFWDGNYGLVAIRSPVP